MSYFPMMTDLYNKNVLVIGGGEEGCKKVQILHGFDAVITLIAKDALKEAVSLADAFYQREFEDADITDAEKEYEMIVASTDDRRLNARISALAKERRIPVNVVDDTELCTFIFPAIVKEKDVVCAVSSGGKSPYVAQYVKRLIIENMPADIGEINDRMGEFRKQAKKEIDDTTKRRAFLRERLEELLGARPSAQVKEQLDKNTKT